MIIAAKKFWKNIEKRLDKAGMECYNDEADPRERRESEAKAGKRLDLENWTKVSELRGREAE